MVEILVRGLKPGDREFLGKMMDSVGIEEWNIRDILIENLNKEVIGVGIAMGAVCGRMAKDNVKKLFVLPTIKQLLPCNENIKHRAIAYDALQEIKEFLRSNSDQESGGGWQYATVHLPGQKKIIIYETAKPLGVEGDVFISRSDSNLLLKMKEAFKAEAVVIGEETV